MKKFTLALVWVMLTAQGFVAAAPAGGMGGQMTQDCSGMSMEMEQFASQLNASNKTMFCSQFNDAQRAAAMQMAGKMDASGKPMMSSDQAVQKVATDNKMTPSSQKAPSGCPVK